MSSPTAPIVQIMDARVKVVRIGLRGADGTGGGGGGGGGAPDTARYYVGASDAGLSAEINIGLPTTAGQALRSTGIGAAGWGQLDLADPDATTGILPDAQIPAAITRDSELAAAVAALQPLDSDLTAISALSTQPFGRGLLEMVDAPAAQSYLSVYSTSAVDSLIAAAAAAVGKRARVRAASTANVNTAATGNGSSIDGVTLATGDLVLLKDQSAPAQNGVYSVGASSLSRSSEFDSWAEFPGSLISVAEGSANADTLWLCTSNDGGTLGTTAISFSKMVVAGELLASNNLSDLQNASTARSNLGLGSIATQNANSVTITGGSISGITDLAIADGGTGQSTALAAFDALSPMTTRGDLITRGASNNQRLAIGAAATILRSDGTDVAWASLSTAGIQALNANLTAIAGLSTAANKLTYWTGSGTAALADLSAFARTILDDADATAVKNTLGLLSIADGNKITHANDLIGGTVTITFDGTLGKSGGDSLIGGSGASENLLLGSTSNATRGFVQIRDFIQVLTEDKTNATTTPVFLIDVPSTRTITLSDSSGGFFPGNNIVGLHFGATVVYTQTGGVLGMMTLFQNQAVIKNSSGTTPTLSTGAGFSDSPTIEADTGSITASGWWSYNSSPIYDRINGGTLTISGSHNGYRSSIQVNNAAVTVALAQRFNIVAAAGPGVITLDVGLDIPVMKNSATTNALGIRNAAPYVATETVKAITAVGDAIPKDAELIRLNNTSGSSKTLTSAPTVPDGVDGQLLEIYNGSAQDVVIQDQGTLASSNLRLVATTRTLSTRDRIILRYSSTVGDWCEVAFSNVL